MKLVSIVILNMNGKALSKKCIESIAKNTSYPEYEIIVVDNGSTDGSTELFKKFKSQGIIKALILNKENVGYANGLNQGFEASKGAYIFHLDNDTLVEKGWLGKAVEAAEKYPRKVAAVGSTLVAEKDYGKGLQEKEHIRERLAVCGAAMLYTKEALNTIGMLDAERFSPIYGEEQDWCYRARRAGFAVIETNASRVLHLGGKDTTKGSNAIARYESLETHRLKAMLYNLSLWDFMRHVPGLGLIFINSLRSGMTLHLLRSYWNNARNFREILRERKRRGAMLL